MRKYGSPASNKMLWIIALVLLFMLGLTGLDWVISR